MCLNISRVQIRSRNVCCVDDDYDYDFVYGDHRDYDYPLSFDFLPNCCDVEVDLRVPVPFLRSERSED